MDILLAKLIGSFERFVSVDDTFGVFEIRNLIHEDFDSLIVITGMNHDFIEGTCECGVFRGDFEEALVVHDENHADAARLDDGGEEIGNINGARAFFEEEVGIL